MTTGGVVAAGHSLPQKWVKPAVDAALLPAHAQTSTCNVQCGVGISLSWSPETVSDLVDLLVGTPGGTMIDPKGTVMGQCLMHQGDETGTGGVERVTNITDPFIAAGTYRIFVRRIADNDDLENASLRVTTCDGYDSVNVCLPGSSADVFEAGSVVVNANGSTQINLNGSC
jgi:hypothetical protein